MPCLFVSCAGFSCPLLAGFPLTVALAPVHDKDESEESFRKRLPIVSFSIGDSAEFLYCDVRDEVKAEKVTLESGDVLIFGGDAGHIFNGVSCIIPNTGPKILIDKTTKLRPGYLNLTFRQY
ncbi:alkylated DNA repair protein [Dendrobium catenatum]|uniref:Alkylated DNA repair protein n=1 Tax=Dendrobium catenatum TaxID=906689 RepID=A0A2I0W177_9ASPA|nr:alkylated DNA repair protein [Dendrobium catenatum]